VFISKGLSKFDLSSLSLSLPLVGVGLWALYSERSLATRSVQTSHRGDAELDKESNDRCVVACMLLQIRAKHYDSFLSINSFPWNSNRDVTSS